MFVHWLVWNVLLTTIPEDFSPETAVEGTSDFGEVGYGGPAPPDDPHTYRFDCFALDGTLGQAARPSRSSPQRSRAACLPGRNSGGPTRRRPHSSGSELSACSRASRT